MYTTPHYTLRTTHYHSTHYTVLAVPLRQALPDPVLLATLHYTSISHSTKRPFSFCPSGYKYPSRPSPSLSARVWVSPVRHITTNKYRTLHTVPSHQHQPRPRPRLASPLYFRLFPIQRITTKHRTTQNNNKTLPNPATQTLERQLRFWPCNITSHLQPRPDPERRTAAYPVIKLF